MKNSYSFEYAVNNGKMRITSQPEYTRDKWSKRYTVDGEKFDIQSCAYPNSGFHMLFLRGSSKLCDNDIMETAYFENEQGMFKAMMLAQKDMQKGVNSSDWINNMSLPF